MFSKSSLVSVCTSLPHMQGLSQHPCSSQAYSFHQVLLVWHFHTPCQPFKAWLCRDGMSAVRAQTWQQFRGLCSPDACLQIFENTKIRVC